VRNITNASSGFWQEQPKPLMQSVGMTLHVKLNEQIPLFISKLLNQIN